MSKLRTVAEMMGDTFMGLCESPIEEMMAIALVRFPWEGGAAVDANDAGLRPISSYVDFAKHMVLGLTPPDVALRRSILRGVVDIEPQVPILRFRADFVVSLRGHTPVVVECDGKEFHSTEAQVKSDIERQRAIEAVGYTVVRLRGREIFADAPSCAAKVRRSMVRLAVAA